MVSQRREEEEVKSIAQLRPSRVREGESEEDVGLG